MSRRKQKRLHVAPVLPLALLLAAAPVSARAASDLAARAESVTPVSPDKEVSATVWLNLHNSAALDAAVANIYEPGSPAFHKWLKPTDLAKYLPTAAEVETVKKELTGHGLTVTQTESHNAYLRVSGSAAAVQSAFHTQLKSYQVAGRSVIASESAPRVGGDAASLVKAVAGLSGIYDRPDNVRPVDPDTGKAFPAVPVSGPNGIVYSSGCFRGTESHFYRTQGASLPVATYFGNRYGANITNTAAGTLPPCGYSPAEVDSAYGMNDLYKKGLDGTGQTIVIVDAYGSPTITADANLFSQLNGLPALTSKNFQVIYPNGKPAKQDTGWASEVTLDVEWAHALAPGANIVLLVAPTNYDNDLQNAVFYALSNEIGNVITNSYGAPESDYAMYPDERLLWGTLNQLAAGLGISIQFSSGDDGDLVVANGTKSVSLEGSSPYATSIGGTSLAIDKYLHKSFEAGWGTNITKIANPNVNGIGQVIDPPNSLGFLFGSGGGESKYYQKPNWQVNVPGSRRAQPDVSMVADPYTGVEIIATGSSISVGGPDQPIIEVIGGTSLASPAFAGVWAIADQYAGGTLGQAAPIIAKLPASALYDVVPYSSPTNVTGTVVDKSGAHFYSASALAEPLQITNGFLSELYNGLSSSWYVLTFGTDTSLQVEPGWDFVTGYGTPKGLAFVQAAAGK